MKLVGAGQLYVGRLNSGVICTSSRETSWIPPGNVVWTWGSSRKG